jgi:hypothetical protein
MDPRSIVICLVIGAVDLGLSATLLSTFRGVSTPIADPLISGIVVSTIGAVILLLSAIL